jgi:hypothetical protein
MLRATAWAKHGKQNMFFNYEPKIDSAVQDLMLQYRNPSTILPRPFRDPSAILQYRN